MDHKSSESIEQIVQLVGWRGSVQAARTWGDVESELGIALPLDYKNILERFPSGTYRDAISVINPIDARTGWEKFKSVHFYGVLEAFGNPEYGLLDETSYRVFPEPGGLVPWGNDGTGGQFFWLANSGNPDSWPVVFNDRDTDEWRESNDSTSEVILDILTCRDDKNILRWDLGSIPVQFRVPSVHLGNDVWKPLPGYE